jgi:Rieske 2Fe-2S family protein
MEWYAMAVRTPPRAEPIEEAYRDGYSLPQVAYTSEDVFAAELEGVFLANWLFVATSSAVAAEGQLTWSVAGESVVLSRTADGVLYAHHNVCRHRGSRLLPDGRGNSRAIVCGYHAWAYGLDGAFRAAGHMGDRFRGQCGPHLGLRPVHVRECSGFVFVCFAADPPPFDGCEAAIRQHVAPYEVDRTREVARYHYRVAANWKILVENNRECYHCRPNHPEFCLSNFDLGMNGDHRSSAVYRAQVEVQRERWHEQGLPAEAVNFPDGSFYRVARLPLRDGFETESTTGRLVAPPLGRLVRSPGGGMYAGSVRVVTLPNSWNHVNADYVVTSRLTPVRVDVTDVEVAFLVREDARESVDFAVDDVVRVWKQTSEQDWTLCERNFAGVRSRGYEPGPLSPVAEQSVVEFHQWWLRQLRALV